VTTTNEPTTTASTTPDAPVDGVVVQEVPIDRVQPARDNPRGKEVGDVDELAASIAKVGVLQPVTVTPRGRRLVLVYGHRRLKAARQAGLATIPTIVRQMTEVERIARQTIENFHREGLTPMQDATAIANLRDAIAAERDGQAPGQRELAEMLGVSQSHVSKHLALLELPKVTREAVDSAGITLEHAQELHKLVAVGRDKQAEALTRQQLAGALKDWSGRSVLADRVAAEVREAKAQAREAEVRSGLLAAGHRVLDKPEGGWWSSPAACIAQGQPHDERHCLWTGVELATITVEEHAGAHPEGHAAAICEQHGEAVWVCTDATGHAEAEDQAAEQAASRAAHEDANRERRERDRQLGRAARAREAFLVTLMEQPVKVPAGARGLLADMVVVGLARLETDAGKIACRLLGLEPVVEQPSWQGARPHKNHREAVRRYAQDPAQLGRVARAVWLSEGEAWTKQTYGTWGRLELRYLDQLVAAGYVLSPVEQERHQESMAALQEREQRAEHGDDASPEESAGDADSDEQLEVSDDAVPEPAVT
jgi:ParB/RepB/Spo0J family partition protein